MKTEVRLNTASTQVILCAVFALIAFAGNSVLCRLALGNDSIDAASFTIIRLLSGSLVLAFVLFLKRRTVNQNAKGSWLASMMLFVYAVAFSYGYITLDTGTGALILFGAVQLTMILYSVAKGNKLHLIQWAGLCCAFGGFVYLVLPTLATPSLTGFVLMTISGIGWGFYSLIGKGSTNAMADTAYNFIRTTPLVMLLLLWAYTYADASWSQSGIVLAVLSGALTSGLGYALWYVALGGLTITQAAVIQLFVPIIAAIGGVIFAGEILTIRLMTASVLVLGGIFMVIYGKKAPHRVDAKLR
jgi:drug/metabolite transporter (DMT)-like permease